MDNDHLIIEPPITDQTKSVGPPTSQLPGSPLRGPVTRLRDRVSAVVLSFIIITIIAVGVIAVFATNYISNQAQQISTETLRTQAETYLGQLTDSAAGENDLILDRAAKDVQTLAETAATIFTKMGAEPAIPDGGDENQPGETDFNYSAYWPADEHMFLTENGIYMNGEEDLSTVFVPIFQEYNTAVIRDIELGGYLEISLASIYKHNPNADAVYFATPHEVTRYYPNIGLGALVPPDFQVTGRSWYVETLANNSSGAEIAPTWVPVYLDATGLGLVTTVALPVYDPGDQLLGVVGLDVTLDEVSANLQATKILESGYFFLIDANGTAIILPDQGYLDILGRQPEPDEFGADLFSATTGQADRPFGSMIKRMVTGEQGFETLLLGDQELFVAYAPLPSTGWSLGSVVRAEDVLGATASLQQELRQTTTNLLLTRLLPILTAIAIGIVILSLIWTNNLVRPIQELAKTAQLIGAGKWDVHIPVKSNDEVGLLASTLRTMTDQLRTTFRDLESRVSERTRQLERRSLQLQTASEVARDITTATNLGEMLDRAVRLINDRFNFYYVGLFLTDETDTQAYLAAASGHSSKEMMQSGLQLRVGLEGIVGFVISTRQPRVVSDVSLDSAYLEHPLLPDTRSEVALPLRAGSQVIGALDVQSIEVDSFAPEDVTVLQTLADQLATAIDNIRLVERLQTTLQEVSVFYQEEVRRSWSSQALAQNIAYEFDQMRVRAITPTQITAGNEAQAAANKLVVPVKLRDEIIGYIGLESDDPGHQWTEDEKTIVEATANQAALTLENARLIVETQRQAGREQMMAQVAAQVRASLDLETVLQTAIREIGHAMDIDDVEIRLGGVKSGGGLPSGETSRASAGDNGKEAPRV